MHHPHKSILFAAPINFGFSDAIKLELEKLGYKVFDFSILDYQPFKYKSIYQRLYNLYRKVILNDYSYKKKLKELAREEYLYNYIENAPYCDYGFIIRPDFYSISFTTSLKNKVKSLIAYQWDGFARFPDVKQYIDLFDKFYIFDNNDLSNKTLPSTNFFFNTFNSSNNKSNKEAYFIGSFEEKRMPNILSLKRVLNENGIKDNIIIFLDKTFNTDADKKLVINGGLKYIDKYTTYKENLEYAINSSILIDIQNPIHDGLSFRVFEALGFNKKLITTNAEITKYEFYHPNNIFVWNGVNEGDLKPFIDAEFIPIDLAIKRKYSFENWIKYMLDDGEYIAIDLPK